MPVNPPWPNALSERPRPALLEKLVRMSQQRAGEILDTANQEAAEVRRGADEYAAGVLIRLEGECIKALTSIKRGIDMLDERYRPPRSDSDGVGDPMSMEVESEALGSAAGS